MSGSVTTGQRCLRMVRRGSRLCGCLDVISNESNDLYLVYCNIVHTARPCSNVGCKNTKFSCPSHVSRLKITISFGAPEPYIIHNNNNNNKQSQVSIRV
jgi:hypothetical protein